MAAGSPLGPSLGALLVLALAAASAGLAPDCQRCSCSQQASIYTLKCQFSGSEAVVLDGRRALNFTSRTVYVRLEAAGLVDVRPAFLSALRRFQSVALDLWNIRRLTLPAGFQPRKAFQFMGIGIVNSSLPELPQGIVSHSHAMGFRLTNSTIGVIKTGAFDHINMVRYVEMTDSRVDTVEGGMTRPMTLRHKQNVHLGSMGFSILGCTIGVMHKLAFNIFMPTSDEFVSISESTIAELGPQALSAAGIGAVTINATSFGFLASAALSLAVRRVTLSDTVIAAAAPLPLGQILGGNETTLRNVAFLQRPAPALLLLRSPSGAERVANLSFRCGAWEPAWAAALGRRATVPAGTRRYLQAVAAAGRCGAAAGALEAPPPARSARLFGSPARLGLELLLLAAGAAAVGAVVFAAARRWRARRSARPDVRPLVNAPENHYENVPE